MRADNNAFGADVVSNLLVAVTGIVAAALGEWLRGYAWFLLPLGVVVAMRSAFALGQLAERNKRN